MKFNIPNLKKGPERDALADCIDYAAEHSNLSDERVFFVLSRFFERVADNMCAGHIVPFPSFGKWGARLEDRKLRLAQHNRGFPYCVPRFVASRPLSEQVKTTAPCNSNAKDGLDTLCRNASRAKPTQARVHSDQQRYRDSISKQLGL